jgi:hypothetical protein
MTDQIQLLDLFPHASESFRRLNRLPPSLPPHGISSRPVVERCPRARALGKAQAEACDTGRFLVRVTSYRRRLLDEDNLCEKYFVDCCRYAGLISGDEAGRTKIEVSQEKVARKEDERTEIEITRLTPCSPASPIG